MKNGDEGPLTEDAPMDWEVLARFMAGESPADEAAAVRAWLADNPARHDVLRALDSALEPVSAPPAGLDVEAALAKVHARMDAPETPVIPFRAPSTRRPASPWRSPALRIAAAVLVLIGGFFAWQAVRGGGASGTLAYTTGVGERDSVRLPDGTQVVLGPGSQLTLSEGYGEGAREVTLRGEALFTVTHDDARPFSVRAGDAVVRDIGTTFAVTADSAAGVRVVVTQGSVALRGMDDAPSEEMVLRQGDRGRMEDGEMRAERAAATDDDLAWTRGQLVFRDAPLDEVSAELRRWYGITLLVDDGPVAERRLTAEFQDESPQDVLRVIALALGADVTTRGDTAVLTAAPGAP